MEMVETELRVRYAETDQMGVAHHSNYLIWCELARVEFCRARGVDYRLLEEEEGILLVVAETQCRHVGVARFDDDIVIATRLQKANPRVLEFGYELRRKRDGALLARAMTKHVFCNRRLQPTRLPAKYHTGMGISRSVGVNGEGGCGRKPA